MDERPNFLSFLAMMGPTPGREVTGTEMSIFRNR